MINPVKKLQIEIYPHGDVTQWFAENPSLYAFLGLKGHNGVDIVRPHGEIMYAIEDGEVVSTEEDPKGFGRNVRILSDAKDKQGRYRLWVYGHNSKNLVKQGDKVKEGQAIALMGNTGFVVSGDTPFWKSNPYRGTHLHLGLRYVKRPTTGGWAYKGSKIKIDVINHGNGYNGSVDPVPLLWQCEDQPETDIWRQSALTLISVANNLISLLKK